MKKGMILLKITNQPTTMISCVFVGVCVWVWIYNKREGAQCICPVYSSVHFSVIDLYVSLFIYPSIYR